MLFFKVWIDDVQNCDVCVDQFEIFGLIWSDDLDGLDEGVSFEGRDQN